jgi:hypothetical protein
MTHPIPAGVRALSGSSDTLSTQRASASRGKGHWMAAPQRERQGTFFTPPLHAFVDAYGDPGLDVEKGATTAAFIVAAVLVRDENLPATRAALDMVRQQHFGNGPIKSNRVGDDDDRRLRVLTAILMLPLEFAAVAFDKVRLYRDGELLYPGLRFKSTFYKFTHRQLFEPLYSKHVGMHVLADRFGREEYMDGFRDYVLKRQRSLFVNHTFDFSGSREDVLIQAADFVAGSLARIYDPKKLSPRAGEILRVLYPKARFVFDWPKRFQRAPSPLGSSKHDAVVREFSREQVWSYLRQYEQIEDEEVVGRVETLNRLLFAAEVEDGDPWVATSKLQDYLGHKTDAAWSEHQIRSKVIAALRDAGVLIASSPNGYKIPSSASDMSEFFEHAQRVVVPLINRVRTAHEALLQVTDSGLDLLGLPDFADLRDLVYGPRLPPRDAS